MLLHKFTRADVLRGLWVGILAAAVVVTVSMVTTSVVTRISAETSPRESHPDPDTNPAQTEPALNKPAVRDLKDIVPATKRLLEENRRLMAQIDFPAEQGDGVSLDDFLKGSTNIMGQWVARRKALEQDYLWIQARESDLMLARKEKARAESAAALQRVMADEEQRARTRADLHRQIQALLDENALRLGRKFRYGFHIKLNKETQSAGPLDPVAIKARRDALLRLEDNLLTSQEFKIQAQRTGESIHSYVTYWTKWSFDGLLTEEKKPVAEERKAQKREIAALEKDPPKEVQKETVKRKEEPRKEEKKPAEKKAIVQKQPETKVRGTCARSEMNVSAYSAYVGGLKRSCPATDLPDIVIKRCEESFVTLDLSTCEKRQLFNFLLFAGENRYGRFDSLDFFEESCYAFQPFVELARKYLADPSSALDFQEKAKLAHAIETAGRCASETYK